MTMFRCTREEFEAMSTGELLARIAAYFGSDPNPGTKPDKRVAKNKNKLQPRET